MSTPLTFNQFAALLEGAAFQNLEPRLLREVLGLCNGVDAKIESLQDLEEMLRKDVTFGFRKYVDRTAARELWNRFELAAKAHVRA
jgi:hypothetical protein